MTKKPILLIDMDGVKADYYEGFTREWAKRFPNRPVIPAKDLKSFYIEDAYGQEYVEDIQKITRAEGFFRSLPPVPGAIEALQSIISEGEFDPFICTAPEIDAVSQCCFSEKAQWIEHHLGKEWLKRTILSKDKTMIYGDYLIDDKPTITGALAQPIWEHIVFTHEYNKHKSNLRLNSWADWPMVKQYLLQLHRNKKERQ